MTSKKPPFHVQFAEKIIERLQAGTAPWQKPWVPGRRAAPYNPVSGTVYKGVNRLHLAMADFSDPRWMTLKQANAEGLRIKSGSKAMPVVYYQCSREETKLDQDNVPVMGKDGKPEKEIVLLERPLLRFAFVFNAEHIEGMPELEHSDGLYAWNPAEKAEALLAGSGAALRHDQENRAYYHVLRDEIHLPPRTRFVTPERYYATVLHELAHWTGHAGRMNRVFGPRGSETYAREELRAEIASWMLGDDLGTGHDPDQHAAYVQSWIQLLRQDPMEIMRACRDAERIKEYMQGLEQQRATELDAVREPDAGQEKAHGAQAMNAPQDQPIKDTAAAEKIWLQVPYVEKERAKAAGARWDRNAKLWYAPKGSDMEKLLPWLKPRERATQETPAALSPQEEFAERLRDAGLDFQGRLPAMDGALHRVPLANGKPGRRDGAYKGYLNGLPAGWFQNHVAGETGTWKYSGHKLEPAELARLREAALRNREQKTADLKEQHEKAARRCYAIWKQAQAASDEHPYLQAKGVPAYGLKTDDKNNLLIPGWTVEGGIQTVQFITPGADLQEKTGISGTSPTPVKRFERGAAKTGAFHVIDPEGLFGNGRIVIAEGYATAASLHLATGLPVVCAFDAGNLVHVAEALRGKFPENEICLMADNDQRLAVQGLRNIGVEKAKSAAELVGGTVFAPEFTPEEARKGLKDWNDLHQAHGLGEMQRQIGDFSRPLFRGAAQERHGKEQTTGLERAV